MLFWVMAGLAMYLATIYLPSVLFLPTEGLTNYVGSRDNMPASSKYVARARRAASNTQENMPIFLSLAVLALVLEGTDMEQAVFGAQLFVIARIAYVGLYLVSIPWTRSAAYTVGLVGCSFMALALI